MRRKKIEFVYISFKDWCWFSGLIISIPTLISYYNGTKITWLLALGLILLLIWFILKIKEDGEEIKKSFDKKQHERQRRK